MPETGQTLNAGQKLWNVQRQQKTGLCVGLDPHYDSHGTLNKEFYSQFAEGNNADDLRDIFQRAAEIGLLLSPVSVLPQVRIEETVPFLTGLTHYYRRVIRAAWHAGGIRIFKPQASFYERLGLAGDIVLAILCSEIRYLGAVFGGPYYLIFDGKREDIASTMEAYYAAYLSGQNDEVIPGVPGQFGFDTMTVTMWLGEDVLTPGLPFFKRGKGAIVVTRSSNPSGTTLQDATVLPGHSSANLALGRFRYDMVMHHDLVNFLDRDPMAHELMLWNTTQFSAEHGLGEGGISPIFSVMGSTVEMSQSFRRIRGNGAIALIPGFGHQVGNFKNIEPLLVHEGPLQGHWGILASARAHNVPWMKQYGGSGNPGDLEQEMERAISGFRLAERQAYEDARASYPF